MQVCTFKMAKDIIAHVQSQYGGSCSCLMRAVDQKPDTHLDLEWLKVATLFM